MDAKMVKTIKNAKKREKCNFFRCAGLDFVPKLKCEWDAGDVRDRLRIAGSIDWSSFRSVGFKNPDIGTKKDEPKKNHNISEKNEKNVEK